MIVDQTRRQIPARSGILESTNQFAVLGIDADDGEAAALEVIPKVAEVEELVVAVGAEVVGELLVIDAWRVRLQPGGEIRLGQVECRKPLKEREANPRAATTTSPAATTNALAARNANYGTVRARKKSICKSP
jgi:hypothetical protein